MPQTPLERAAIRAWLQQQLAALTPTGLPPEGIFGPQSIWKMRVDGDRPLHPDSTAIVADLCTQRGATPDTSASLNVWQYNVSFWVADPDSPRVPVGYNRGTSTTGPAWWAAALGDFPLPIGAAPSAGNDASISVWDPASDTLWTAWKFRQVDGQWVASWGGKLAHVSTAPGWYPGGSGTTASGLAIEGGCVTLADARAGVIDHALGFGIVNPASWSQVSWPAQRSDGSPGSSGKVMEGQRFRLPAAVDVNALNVHPLCKAVARAVQTYGLIATDRSGVIAIGAEQGTATLGADPNPWNAVLAPKHSYDVLAGFPWQQLQALPRDYGKPA